MYSYDDRIRAVKLYIKLGKRIELTIKQLGYPTKNSLKSWHKEYELVKDLAFSFVRERSKYSVQQKQAAVEHYLNHGRCFIETIKALGYPCRDTLAAWLDDLHPDMRRHVVGRAKNVIYPEEFKQTAVIELCTREVSAQVISQKLGITRPTLYKWKDQLLGHEAPTNMKHNNDPPPIAEQQELELQIQTLRRNIRQLQLENDILKKANELIKKDLGVDQPLLTNREKTLLVDALRQSYELSELLPELDLARSSYFYHQARLRRSDKYADARLAMRDIFKNNHHCYGYRRMHAALGRQQVCLSEKVVRRLMKQECLVVAAKKRRRFGSYQGEISPAPENLINRDFHAATPNEKWLTDITEFHIPAGKVYLSPIIDCFDGLVISWSIGTSPDANLVNTMLDAAITKLPNGHLKPVVHSDRGAHYRWPGWLARMKDAELIRSMSRKGCSPDNSACEGFFGRLKTEMFYHKDWKDITIEQFIQAIDSYICWYNEKRIKISLGSLSPLEYRASLGYKI